MDTVRLNKIEIGDFLLDERHRHDRLFSIMDMDMDMEWTAKSTEGAVVVDRTPYSTFKSKSRWTAAEGQAPLSNEDPTSSSCEIMVQQKLATLETEGFSNSDAHLPVLIVREHLRALNIPSRAVLDVGGKQCGNVQRS